MMMELLERRELMSGGPSATLAANTILGNLGSSYTFNVTYMDPDGVLVSSIDNNDIRVSGPNGWSYGALLVSLTNSSDGKTCTAKYKIGAPNGEWNDRANGAYTVTLRASEVRDNPGNYSTGGSLGQFLVAIAGPAPAPPLVTRGINVKDFGAIPNDGLDDTAAITAAMDYMWFNFKGDGSPRGGNRVGGIVNFDAGQFDISGPIYVFSGIWMKGSAAGTTIKDTNRDRTSAAFILHSPYNHGFNVGAKFSDLSIYTAYTAGIKLVPMTGDLIDLRIYNMKINAGGVGIDLRAENTYHTIIRNIQVNNPGSTALWLGSVDNVNTNNLVDNLRVTGTARSSFAAEKGLVVLHGITHVTGLTVENIKAQVVPLFVSSRSSITGFVCNLATGYLPAGAVAQLDHADRVYFDALSNLDAQRHLKLVDAHDVSIGILTTNGGVALKTVIDTDSTSHAFVSGMGAPTTTTPTMPVLPTNVLDAAAYGVIANDALDDTAAIQNAISAARAIGGAIIQLPMGQIDTTSRLKLYSGVYLRGVGSGTLIRDSSSDPRHAAIEFLGTSTGAVRTGVMDLSILSSNRAKGIMADPGMTGPLTNMLVSNVKMSAGSAAIDLRTANVVNSVIEDVLVSDPGSIILWLGKDNAGSKGNRVDGFRMVGSPRANFVTDKALIVLNGETTFMGVTIELANAPTILPLYVSGVMNLTGLHWEYSSVVDNTAILFENTTKVAMDGVANIDHNQILKLINAKNVNLGYLGAFGSTDDARAVLNVDSNSSITVGTADFQYDSGLLDHPRVHILGAYNRHAFAYVENREPSALENLIADPNALDWSDGSFDTDWKWRLVNASPQTYSVSSVDQTGGTKVEINVLSNPSGGDVAVQVKLNTPANLIGKRVIVRWRIDGPGLAQAWLGQSGANGYLDRINADVTKSQTSGRSVYTLTGNDQLTFLLPAALGVYKISKFSVRAE